MPKKSTDEGVINHYGAVRLRVKGSASLLLALFSLDEVQLNVLVPISLSTTTAVEPNRLSNFTQQRAKLQVRVVGIDQTFLISKIIMFIKPTAKSYPEMT